ISKVIRISLPKSHKSAWDSKMCEFHCPNRISHWEIQSYTKHIGQFEQPGINPEVIRTYSLIHRPAGTPQEEIDVYYASKLLQLNKSIKEGIQNERLVSYFCQKHVTQFIYIACFLCIYVLFYILVYIVYGFYFLFICHTDYFFVFLAKL